MEQLTCAVCGEQVFGRVGKCPRCDNLLSLPGAVISVEVPTSPGPSDEGPEPPTDGGASGPGAGGSTADGEPVCATPGCGRPARPGQAYCQDCLLNPAARSRPRARTFRLLAPWSEVIEILDGSSLALGRDPNFCPCAARLKDNHFVSGRHLLLTAEDGRLHARDLDSHNGTTRNSQPLRPDEKVELVTHDALTLGGEVTFFVVV